MNPTITTLLLLFLVHWCPLQGTEEAPLNIDPELETLGDIFDCAVAINRIDLPANQKHILRINKNGKDTAQFDLSGVNKVTMIICKGRGLGSSPRVMDGPEGIQIRILAYRSDGYDVYSVSYAIPTNGTRTRGHSLELPILFERVDLGEDGSLLGNLRLSISKAGEQSGTDQSATTPESKSEGDEKSKTEAEDRSR